MAELKSDTAKAKRSFITGVTVTDLLPKHPDPRAASQGIFDALTRVKNLHKFQLCMTRQVCASWQTEEVDRLYRLA